MYIDEVFSGAYFLREVSSRAVLRGFGQEIYAPGFIPSFSMVPHSPLSLASGYVASRPDVLL